MSGQEDSTGTSGDTPTQTEPSLPPFPGSGFWGRVYCLAPVAAARGRWLEVRDGAGPVLGWGLGLVEDCVTSAVLRVKTVGEAVPFVTGG